MPPKKYMETQYAKLFKLQATMRGLQHAYSELVSDMNNLIDEKIVSDGKCDALEEEKKELEKRVVRHHEQFQDLEKEDSTGYWNSRELEILELEEVVDGLGYDVKELKRQLPHLQSENKQLKEKVEDLTGRLKVAYGETPYVYTGPWVPKG